MLKINKMVAKAGDTWAIHLRKFSSKFLRLCVDVILFGYCSSTHKLRNLLENLHQFFARVSPALGSNMSDKSKRNMPEFTPVISKNRKILQSCKYYMSEIFIYFARFEQLILLWTNSCKGNQQYSNAIFFFLQVERY